MPGNNNIFHGSKTPKRGPNNRIPPRHADRRIPTFRNVVELPVPSRLQRPKERWQGLSAATRLATITVLQHGGHKRPIITRGGKHLRARMGSRKTGLQQIVEGRGHRDLVKLNEVDPNVLDYQAHPFEIEFQLQGQLKVYYPDHIRVLRDGTIELIEVKPTPEDLGDDEYVEKLAGVAEIARRVGWHFRILYEADIRGPKERSTNVEVIYMHRFKQLTRCEQEAITRFVVRDKPSTWGELLDVVCPGDHRRGNAVLFCSIALGRISINLDEAVCSSTSVIPCPIPSPHRGIRI